MLDPMEMAAFEEWKQKKLLDGVDLSVASFNSEMEIQAMAWDAGARQALTVADGTLIPATYEQVKAQNPHRKPGMLGHTPKRVTG